MVAFSKTQIDRLGDRLRAVSTTDADLRQLDAYRRSFGEAYDTVVRTIRDELHLEPTGRPAKSTRALIEKLRRESIRLSQVQDIAGCRLVVSDIVEQDRVVAAVREAFSGAAIIDRRLRPTHGYRAVHLVPRVFGTLVEIQVRTALQHLWAELSEKGSDVLDPQLKYGGGAGEVAVALRRLLGGLSEEITRFEQVQREISDRPPEVREQWQRLQMRHQVELTAMLNRNIARLTHPQEPPP